MFEKIICGTLFVFMFSTLAVAEQVRGNSALKIITNGKVKSSHMSFQRGAVNAIYSVSYDKKFWLCRVDVSAKWHKYKGIEAETAYCTFVVGN